MIKEKYVYRYTDILGEAEDNIENEYFDAAQVKVEDVDIAANTDPNLTKEELNVINNEIKRLKRMIKQGLDKLYNDYEHYEYLRNRGIL